MRLKVVVVSLALVLAGACKKKSDNETPAAGSGSAMAGSGSAEGSGGAMAGSGSAEGSGGAMAGSGSDAGSGSAAAAGCTIKVKIAADHVEWAGATGAGGGTSVAGSTFDQKPLVDWIASLAGTDCSAEITGDPKVPYQLVIYTMDVLQKAGVKDLALDAGGTGPASSGGPPPSKDDLQKMAVIVITKTAVQIDGKDVVKVGDTKNAKLGAALAELQKAKPGKTMILQADASLDYVTVADVIAAGKGAGFTDVLFAVKNK